MKLEVGTKTYLYCGICGNKFLTPLTEDEYGNEHGNLYCPECRKEAEL